MNRIAELLAQATDYADATYKYDPITGFQIQEWDLIRIKHFAELIVRECIDIAHEYDAPKLSGPGMIIGNRIEQHFGVEE